ncbi:MAG: molybdenum cofactor guanylyltransferase [Bacteroidales bacterium]|nr:molybdenum cofactor guanylyltransferase [Bacteroidales bacterium]MCF8402630.1 molybdenum cofactor guanylyltransferase [Bacteroidales bacterium]
MENISGIILSGGKSKRMGEEKGLCQINGRAMVEYALDTLEEICDPIVIGANNNNYDHYGFRVVNDIVHDVGPIGGLYSCLKASTTNHNFVLSCDMPMVSKELVKYILSEARDYDVVIPIFKDYKEPLCTYYHKNVVSGLYEAMQKGVYKIQEAILSLNVKYLEIHPRLSFYSDYLFNNINHRDDLIKAEDIMIKHKG